MPAMLACRECRAPVRAEALRCMNCGAPVLAKRSKLPLVLVVVIGLAAAGYALFRFRAG